MRTPARASAIFTVCIVWEKRYAHIAAVVIRITNFKLLKFQYESHKTSKEPPILTLRTQSHQIQTYKPSNSSISRTKHNSKSKNLTSRRRNQSTTKNNREHIPRLCNAPLKKITHRITEPSRRRQKQSKFSNFSSS